MTIVHKVNRYIFFYLVNVRKRNKKILEKQLTKADSFEHTYIAQKSQATLSHQHTYEMMMMMTVMILAIDKIIQHASDDRRC